MSDKETNSGLSDKDQAMLNDIKVRTALLKIGMHMSIRSEEGWDNRNEVWYDLVNDIKKILESSGETGTLVGDIMHDQKTKTPEEILKDAQAELD